MNILAIGNGFDLAHGLPTKYTDFLEFVKVIKQVFDNFGLENLEIDWGEINFKVKKQIIEKMGNVQDNLYSEDAMWIDLIGNNFWIDYFQQNPMYQKENWIDFESEISNIIRSLDKDMKSQLGRKLKLEDKIQCITNDFLNKEYLSWFGTKTYKELRDKLLGDLNKLIRAFEIYLCEYVEKIDIKKKLPDIENLDIDFILSFNYTHTFSKLYDVSRRSKEEVDDPFDYIHGEANMDNTIKTNNMVLGIDEYLGKKRRNKNIEFIAFKKYYQRIYKQTGCEYKKWVEIIKNQLQNIDDKIKKQYPTQIPYKNIPNKFRNQLYIFGHSLDITDKDILRDLILNDNVCTTIFYLNKDVMGQQIANLVKVIGQDELIRRTGGSTKTIEFKQQKKDGVNMVIE